uniref:Uncharacterized protein n=1 Tax=Molossus molossus TaxID=27622 RepID=A0A7J8JW07_MOLMO|nr:hypothetical protein HJG59_007262 [Molossus molossus]
MSKPSRVARRFFTNTASKLPSSRRDDLNRRQKKTSLGEKSLRTGSEGNLVKQRQVRGGPCREEGGAQNKEKAICM